MTNHKLFVRPRAKSNPKVRLFCFPFAGGGINTYLAWSDKFSKDVELILVQPPGRGARILETPHSNMSSLVNELIHHTSFITQTPYIFFGHSLGCRVAFELCCRFKSNGKRLPMYFIASGSRAPHLPNECGTSHDLPHEEFIKSLEKLKGTPREVLQNEELMSLLIPLLRADFRIAETYRASQIKMPFPILVFHGKSDFNIKVEQLEAWIDLTNKDYKLVEFEGDHFFINETGDQITSYIEKLITMLLRCNYTNSDPYQLSDTLLSE